MESRSMMRPGDSECSGAFDAGRLCGASQSSRARSRSSARSLRNWLVRVDAALDSCQLSVCGAGRAGLVFDVPEIEVGAVVARDALQPVQIDRLADTSDSCARRR